MLPDIEELVVRAVFAGAIHHYTVNMPVLSWLRPGGALQWTIQTPNDMSKCACVARSWNVALKQRKKLHVAHLAARVVKMALEYSMGICEVERYAFSDIHGAPNSTEFLNTLRLDKTHLFYIKFTRQRVHALKDDHLLEVNVGIPRIGVDGLSVSHVSPLPDTCWVDASDMCDEQLDEYRAWYIAKKRELRAWLEGQLVLFGVMPPEHM